MLFPSETILTQSRGIRPNMTSNKPRFACRLSEEGMKLIHDLQAYHGVSQAALLEMLLREEARRKGIRHYAVQAEKRRDLP